VDSLVCELPIIDLASANDYPAEPTGRSELRDGDCISCRTAVARSRWAGAFDVKVVACPLRAPYNGMMTAEEVKALPLDEKIRMMEAIWEDFRERFDRMEIPQEQKDLLDQRRARVREGKARLLDWDSVKGTIGKR